MKRLRVCGVPRGDSHHQEGSDLVSVPFLSFSDGGKLVIVNHIQYRTVFDDDDLTVVLRDHLGLIFEVPVKLLQKRVVHLHHHPIAFESATAAEWSASANSRRRCTQYTPVSSKNHGSPIGARLKRSSNS